MDIREFIEQCLDRSLTVQGIITDSPYDHLEKHRSVGTTTRLVNDWFETLSLDEIGDIMGEILDILDPHSHVYFWANTLSVFDLKDVLKSQGYEYNNLLFWVKNRLGMGYNYRNKCEPIIFCSKRKRKAIRDMAQSNVFHYPRPKKMPPYSKPPHIYADILRSASRDKEIWLDPFAGTDPLSSLVDKVYTVKYKKVWYSWSINSIGVDVRFSDSAYLYRGQVLKKLKYYQGGD